MVRINKIEKIYEEHPLNKDISNINFQNKENENSKNVAIIGFKNLTIKANAKNVEVNLKNPIENEGMYFQEFEIRLLKTNSDEYEVIYKSELIEPGKELKEITLLREIEKGEYDAILYVQPYRIDEQKTKTNDAKIKIRLIAE